MAYEVNYCQTKEQFKHLAEVVTSREDGNPSGSKIDYSRLEYANQERKTLDKIISDAISSAVYLPPVEATQGQTVFNIGTGLIGVQVNRGGTIEQTDLWSYDDSTGEVTLNSPASAGESFQFAFNLIPGGTPVGQTVSGIYFAGVENMKAGSKDGSTIDLATLAQNGEYVNTMWYSNFVNGGGGTYRLAVLSDYRTEINDPAWEPNGYRDHYLLGGTEYVAILVQDLIGVEHCAQWGVIVNDELPVTTTSNTLRINAMNAYLCPYEWDTDVETTYFDKTLAGGVIQLSRGFTCVDDVLLWNPHVEYRGLNPVHRMFGKTNPGAGDQLAFIKYTGVEQDIYVIDTANFKNPTPPDEGVRITDSKVSFFNSSIDAKTTAYSEGSFLRNVGIIVGNAVGGFRLIGGMKGGYEGVSISGGIVSYMLSNCWNMTLGSIWTEESIYARLGFENTNLRFVGQTTYVGNFSTKGQITDAQLARLPSYFSSNFASDNNRTLPIVHLKQSKAMFSAFEWDTVYENLTIEFWNNPICVYGDANFKPYLTINKLSEEANANIETIDGNLVNSVLVTGFNAQVRLHEMSSISDVPLQALGTGSVTYVTAAKRWVGESFYPDYMNDEVRGNAFILEEIRTITPKLRMDHNVSIRGLKRDLTIYCDSVTGSDLYFGTDPSEPALLNNIMKGIVQSSTDTGVFTYKPFNQTFEITVRLSAGTLAAPHEHKFGDKSGVTTIGLSDSVRIRFVSEDGLSSETTRIIKEDGNFKGPNFRNCDVEFVGMTLRNNGVVQPNQEKQGLFNSSDMCKFTFKGCIYQETDTQGDGTIITCEDGSYTTIICQGGDMQGVPKGLCGINRGTNSSAIAVIDGVMSGVNNGSSSVNPTGLTDRMVVS